MDWIDSLRKQVHSLHATTHALPYFRALWNHALPLESFVTQLRCLAVVHGTLEKCLTNHDMVDSFRSLLAQYCPKLPLLWNDVEIFAEDQVPNVLPAVEKALNIADLMLTASQETPMALVGFLYTLEGSSLGGRVMEPEIVKNFSLPNGKGTRFFRCYGDQVHARWKSFLNILYLHPFEVDDQKTITHAALELFRRLVDVHGALYPFETDQLGHHAVSLNPEAGRHPIPQNAEEQRAAITAARRCWNTFPYFAMRYKERGRRFAASNAAWLATLCDLDVRTTIDQVFWLAELLSSKGIPTWLMETQLRLLHEELTGARPHERHRYDRLLLAADALRNRRHAMPSEKSITALAQELRERFFSDADIHGKAISEVVAAAAADEASGFKGSLQAVLAWFRRDRNDACTLVDALAVHLREKLGLPP